ncbi:hypothetical protein QFC19_008450 [Naganishia cerealis]|uniref:Uncharacterized protein n=1 Tax=Naganishia cerealis TaxID=610337 RepID=A0ACC2V225_9TREE|nr:hypothetical protein QFC19_008450 [Naganishia cerealis]
MPQARDANLPWREAARTRSQVLQAYSTTRTSDEENIASESQPASSMSDKRVSSSSTSFTSRPSSDRALQRRSSNLKKSSRFQWFRLSDEDDDDDDDDDDELECLDFVDAYATQLFGPKRRKAQASTQPLAVETEIRVKPERPSSQPSSNSRRPQSLAKPPAVPIDLTIVTTDDEALPTITQKSKSTSSSSMSNSQSNPNGKQKQKQKQKKKKKVQNQALDKAKIQAMISGGSGKSGNDSIVLLDTDEEDVNVVRQPIASPAVHASSASTPQPLEAPSTHRSTFAAWRNTAPSSSSARNLTQSDSLSPNPSHPIRNSQLDEPVLPQPTPILCTQPPSSSPSKRRTPPSTSQTCDTFVQEDKRIKEVSPSSLNAKEFSDIDMDKPTNLVEALKPDLLKVEERTTKRRNSPMQVRKVVEVEIRVPMPLRRSSRTPGWTPSPSPPYIKGLSNSPTPRKPSKACDNVLVKKFIKSNHKTLIKEPVTLPPDVNSLTPQSSTMLSKVTLRSRSHGSQTKPPELPVTDEQLDQLTTLCKDVFVKYSDGPDIREFRNDFSDSMTPKPAPESQSSTSRALRTADAITTPRSARSQDVFSSSPLHRAVPSSLPQQSHRDFFSIPSPSQRASMTRTLSGRPMPSSVHSTRYENLLANAAGKRKVLGTPLTEEPMDVNSAKRRHFSPPEKTKHVTPATPKARARAKPVFAISSPAGNVRPVVADAPPLLLSPARSMVSNSGSSPATPFNSGFFSLTETAQASPVQEYDTDKSYVSSSVMEEKMPILIPYQRPEPSTLGQEHFKMDIVKDHVSDTMGHETLKEAGTAEIAEEEEDDLMAMFGDFEWTSDQPQSAAAPTSVGPPSVTPIGKLIDEADETLIDQVLQSSPSINLSPDDLLKEASSPNSDLNIATNSTGTATVSNGGAGNKKALDMFAELKAKYEQGEKEKREREEEARRKVLEDSEDDDSDDDLTSLLDKLKQPTSALKSEDTKAKSYTLRSAIEPAATKPARTAPVPHRASPLPAAFAKVTRDLKKEKTSKTGMTAMELAKMNLRLLEDEQEASDVSSDRKPDVTVSMQIDPIDEESDWSGTEPDDFSEDEDGESDAMDQTQAGDTSADAPVPGSTEHKNPMAEDATLADIPLWQGVWEDLEAEHSGLRTMIPDLATALPVFVPFVKTNAFPTHPIAYAATRTFAIHAPSSFELLFWQAHLWCIHETHLNDPTTRLQATIYWLHCLLSVLKNPASLPSDQAVGMVLLLVKLSIDKRSDFTVRKAVLDCINESVKDLSEDLLMEIASSLARFSEPYAARSTRQRIADTFGIVDPQARALKTMFALSCLERSDAGPIKDNVVGLVTLPKLIQSNSLSSVATTSESPRGVLSAVRMLIQSLTHVHDVIEQIGNHAIRNKDLTMSQADARRSEWTIKREVGNNWRAEMMDSLRWLKSGMINKGKTTSRFRCIANQELTTFLNRFEQTTKYYLDQFRPPKQQVSGPFAFLNVKSGRTTPVSGSSVTGEDTRASSVLSDIGSAGTNLAAARPKPTRRSAKTDA